jgi:hypothetical protein
MCAVVREKIAGMAGQPSDAPRGVPSLPLHVEMIGIPGSGKTRSALLAIGRLKSRRVSVADRLELEAVVSHRFVGLSAPGTAARLAPYLIADLAWAAACVSASLPAPNRLAIVRRLVRITHRLRALREPSCQERHVFLPDEWTFHELALAEADAGRKWTRVADRLVASIVTRLPHRSLVIHCVVSPMAAAERVSVRRTASEYDGRRPMELLPVFEHLAAISARHAALLRAQGVPVVMIDTEMGADPSGCRVADAVESHLHAEQVGSFAVTRSRSAGE